MGAIAEAFVAYAQPLIDQTDGSEEQVRYALSLTQLCFNLAQLPVEDRIERLTEMQASLKMNDHEFVELVETVFSPMLSRYDEIFPKEAQIHRTGKG